jgi:phosphatidate cytidylyltransferase
LSGETYQRLFGWWTALDDPFVAWMLLGVVVVVAVSGATIVGLLRTGVLDARHFPDLWPRWKSWVVLTLAMALPIVLGAASVIAAVGVLSLLCFHEYARATGLFREKLLCAMVVLGILLLCFACADNWGRLYFALASLTTAFLAIATIPQDRPQGYIQRTALAVMGFLLFGYGLCYLAMLANNSQYRGLLLLVLVGVEANDVFAYCVGKAIGGPKLLPNTSPGKTMAGSVGALVLTTGLVATLAHFLYQGQVVDRLDALLILGAGMSVFGQFGDLLLSSIKRDLGLKDIGATIPGHGGLLDRFNSLVLVPPALFHFLSLYLGPLNATAAQRIITGD